MRRWVAPKREVPLSGIINVDKPRGMTSHDVVDAVRRMSGQRRVGHAGTLDPLATGVLLCCLGMATKLSEYLMSGTKRYRAGIMLGRTTDTYDADGAIVSEGGRTDFCRSEIEAALAGYVGRIEQVPPIYSAIKQGGEPLYRRARRGESVDRTPRTVEITELVLLDWTPPSLIIEVDCSAGTYVRSLAHDVGQVLGSGAILTTLVRLRSGSFRLEDAVSLDRLEEAFRHGQEEVYLIPMDEALLDWPALVLDSCEAARVTHGQAIRRSGDLSEQVGGDSHLRCRAYSLDGRFLGILSYHAPADEWRPEKVFASISHERS